MHDPRNLIKATLWAGLALASFCAMAVSIRELAGSMGVFEMLFFRSVIGIAVLLGIVVVRGRGFAPVATRRPYWQVGRNLVHFMGQWLWALGITLLPLSEVFALEFTMPAWVAVLAILFLGEPATRGRLLAVALGFVGVLIILRPGFAVFDPAAFVVLGAAFFFAATNILTKVLTRSDPPLAVPFYMTIIQMPLAFALALLDWRTPGLADLPWLAVLGVSALLAHYGLTRALGYADSTIVAPLDFLRLPLIALVGALLYGESLEIAVFIGSLIIFGGNYLSLRETARRAPAEGRLAGPAQ